ncbi:hypothetical protein [Streptomyces endophyticus]|uniref:hypothetical protein n=1 Tax=Streptomyces endophyticus TaxID=714166 RepID=UPI002DC03F3D|nr:hypothetical protein [Streptomyces endophyticus]
MTGRISERTSERAAFDDIGTGGDADAPRVPVSAGAWGAGSADALGARGGGRAGGEVDVDRASTEQADLEDLEDLDVGLLRDPAAWRLSVLDDGGGARGRADGEGDAGGDGAGADGAGGGAGAGVGVAEFFGAGPRDAESRDVGSRDAESRDVKSRDVERSDVELSDSELSDVEPSGIESRGADTNGADTGSVETRSAESRSADSRDDDFRDVDSRTEADHRADVARIVGPRGDDSRDADPRGANLRPVHRRSGADPVKGLMHRHRELCERAVDPLEIAAGLEAHGVTDRTAARFRHKDVFSLAEEMYARASRDGDPYRPVVEAIGPATGVRGLWAGLALLPGAVCALTLFGLHATAGTARLAIGLVGALATLVALRATLRHGPLRAADGPSAASARLWSCWLLAYALLGDGLLDAALAGGPDEPWAPATAPLVALAVAVAPATWCAQLFSGGARRRLAASRGLAEFAASVRPLLLGAVALFALALVALLVLAGAVLDEKVDYAGAGALGVLLLLARLLAAHRRTHAPAVALGAAVAVEILAVAAVFAARLPGCDVLGLPVETAVDAVGAGIVPTVACAVAALVLLVHATRTLTRASAHANADGPIGWAP